MITQAKKNFLDRLIGRSNDKSRYQNPQQVQDPGQTNDFFSQLLGAKTQGVNPSQPAPTQAGSPTAQTTQPQAQSEDPSGATGAGQGAGKYKLFEMFQPQPTRDTESEEMIRRRQRINAFGSGIGAIAGLAGMATGGDAPFTGDIQTPWNMDEIRRLDQDYRGQLENWIGRRFQTDNLNTQMQNRQVEQDINAQNRMDQINQQGANSMQLAQERAQNQLRQLQAKTQAEQIKEMLSMGIDPNSENAYGEYLQKNQQQFSADLDYTKARTNWNNRPYKTSGNSNTGSNDLPYSLKTLQTGKNAMIQELQQQLKAMPNEITNQEERKALMEQIQSLQSYNPGKNELMDMEIAQRGMEIEDQELAGNQQNEQSNDAQGFPYQPNKGLNINADQMGMKQPTQPTQNQTSEPNIEAVQQEAMTKFQAKLDNIDASKKNMVVEGMGQQVMHNLDRLAGDEPDLDLITEMVEEWASTDLFDSPEDAYQLLTVLILEAQRQRQQ